MNVGTSTNDEYLSLVDNETTHTILQSNKFFSCLVLLEVTISIISSITIEGSRRTIILLPIGIRLHIKNEFYSP